MRQWRGEESNSTIIDAIPRYDYSMRWRSCLLLHGSPCFVRISIVVFRSAGDQDQMYVPRMGTINDSSFCVCGAHRLANRNMTTSCYNYRVRRSVCCNFPEGYSLHPAYRETRDGLDSRQYRCCLCCGLASTGNDLSVVLSRALYPVTSWQEVPSEPTICVNEN